MLPATPLLADATVTAVQTIAVAALVFLGQYVVAKMSNRAQGVTTEVDSQHRATEAWQQYAQEMKGRLDGLEARLGFAERRVHALEVQTVRDLELLRRVYQRLRFFITLLVEHGHAVPEEDHELADLIKLRLDAESLPKE